MNLALVVQEKNTNSVMEKYLNFLESCPPVDEDREFLHVAVGIVQDSQGRYLISKRQAHQRALRMLGVCRWKNSFR